MFILVFGLRLLASSPGIVSQGRSGVTTIRNQSCVWQRQGAQTSEDKVSTNLFYSSKTNLMRPVPIVAYRLLKPWTTGSSPVYLVSEENFGKKI